MNLIAARWPATAVLPTEPIAELPTPLEPLAIPELAAGELLVKRDDLTSAVYGGNKVRKLEFLLGAARQRDAHAVITFGAYGSNHALATAVHSRAIGIEPHVVLSPQEPTAYAQATLLAHAGARTHVHCAETPQEALRVAATVRGELTARDGVEPYVIPAGGSSPTGALGYVNAALEVLEQGDAPDVVYVAGGTLGTAVGLAIGFALAGAPTRVEAARVTPDSVANAEILATLASETLALLRSADPSVPDVAASDLRLRLRDDQFGADYAVPTPQCIEARSLAAAQNLKLETTYSAKALAALVADARAGELEGARVVFWDTYNSAPMPSAGDVEALPTVLQDFIAGCEALG